MAGNKNTAVTNQDSVHGRPGSSTHGKPGSTTVSQTKPKRKTKTRKASKTSRSRTRRTTWRSDDEQTTIFPEVEGKVVREVMFSHEEAESVLVIDFDDRTALSFQFYPEPMVLPVDVQAHYLGERRADKSWEGLARKIDRRDRA